jgi:defect-in-organelle-trafficking protein DotC
MRRWIRDHRAESADRGVLMLIHKAMNKIGPLSKITMVKFVMMCAVGCVLSLPASAQDAGLSQDGTQTTQAFGQNAQASISADVDLSPSAFGSGADYTAPPTLDELKNIPKENNPIDVPALDFDLRKEAVKEAATSYGARGGLAARTGEIRRELDGRTRYLDKVFDFRQLLIPAPSGFLIEPPIINEALNSMIIDTAGQQAAISDRIYRITRNAKIVSNARSWRAYLERVPGIVQPPPDILRPANAEERAEWYKNIQLGWDQGYTQADEIFEEDLNTLMSDFQGMVRYRLLLAQGMVSPPFALQVDRGITGDGNTMRVGDRAVEITGVPELMTGGQGWRPASR